MGEQGVEVISDSAATRGMLPLTRKGAEVKITEKLLRAVGFEGGWQKNPKPELHLQSKIFRRVEDGACLGVTIFEDGVESWAIETWDCCSVYANIPPPESFERLLLLMELLGIPTE